MFGENIKSVFSEILHGKAVAPHSVKQEKNDDNTQYSNYGKAATEFSNPYNDQFHLFNGKGDMHEGLIHWGCLASTISMVLQNLVMEI